MGVYYFYSEFFFDENSWNTQSVSVENEKFARELCGKGNAMELNTDHFWVGPGKVYLDYEEPVYYQTSPENTIKKFIYRGCTLLLCQMPVLSHTNYKEKFNQFKKQLSGMAIDYMIVPRLPVSILKPDLVRYFGRKRLPFILLDANNEQELKEVKWEWIQQAQGLTQIPLLLVTEVQTKNENKKIAGTWESIVETYGIFTIIESSLAVPLSKNMLKMTGISPYKGEILAQASADYNLYLQHKVQSIDEQPEFRYHKAIPEVTVAKGRVIKVNHIIQCLEGSGSYTHVSIPRHFI
ncbi:hypothetical protein [Sediminibacillus albus]|uniref:Uncharacterized protein n=1 Tax=Sediminibacillus albus TaxID=407036 RepID=A0A1G8VNB1_9BACI|nr:hypothetical protein [Sediminibacillus albus]SDJ67551.1 hypothetical protein SAMN05216243_0235 [Sediminibacillus albus]